VPDAVRQLTTGIFEKAYEDWDASLTTAYMQWNIDHVDWKVMEPQLTWLPPLMTSDFRWVEQCWPDNAHRARFLKDHHWRIMIVGQRGAGMFNHKDTLRTASWQVIFQGPKRMQLCPPSSDPHIYQAGDLDTFVRPLAMDECFLVLTAVLVLTHYSPTPPLLVVAHQAPDYVRFPRARNLTCFWAELASGEILYYPRDWWHHTKNLSPDAAGPTYALTGTLVNPDNFDSVTEQMIQTYVGEGKNVLRVGEERRNIECAEGLGGEGSFCDGLLKCFDRWARTFGRQHFLGVEAAASEEEIAEAAAAGEPRMMVRKAAIPMDRPYDEALTAKFEELNRQLVVGEALQPEYEDRLATLMSIHGCPFENGLWRCKEHRSTNAGTTTTEDDEE